MAIQTRRGTYNDFDPEKLLPGEWATVQSDDPASADGKSMYMCFAPGEVKRMATYEDMVQNIDSAVEEIKDQFSAGMQQATDAANTAAGSAAESASAATTAAERANEVAQTIEEAVQGTIINDASPSDLTVYSSQKIEDDFRKKDDIIEPSRGGTGETSLYATLVAMLNQVRAQDITLLSGTSAATTGGGMRGTPRVRKFGPLVFMEGSVSFNVTGEVDQAFAQIPTDYAPENTKTWMATCTGDRLVRLGVTNKGEVKVSWVRNLSDGSEYTGTITWLEISGWWFTTYTTQPDPGP